MTSRSPRRAARRGGAGPGPYNSLVTKLALAVHGGAYDIPDDGIDAHARGCTAALEAGWKILAAGGSALDAVEASVRLMEDDPVFDAGTGSHLTRDGQVECDAAIMEGTRLRAGAVGALREMRHPISVARRLLDTEGPLFLAGEGALLWAIEQGFERADPVSLVTARERERWSRNRVRRNETAGSVFGGDSRTPLGTVGAVARDRDGRLAAATSTGGTPDKYPGRIGDTPLIGCGTYADDRAGAISCTGWGESILRLVLARRAAERVERGATASSAAEGVVAELAARVDGLGGLIIVSPATGAKAASPVGIAFNTPRMARAYRIEGESPFVAVLP
jgi:beta-aspartyl-peptidase (threonine type)